MLVTAAARLELTPLRPMVFYLLEAYSPQQAEGTLAMKVVDSAGKVAHDHSRDEGPGAGRGRRA